MCKLNRKKLQYTNPDVNEIYKRLVWYSISHPMTQLRVKKCYTNVVGQGQRSDVVANW